MPEPPISHVWTLPQLAYAQRRYACSVSDVASRDLRNHTRAVLDRVARGEVLTVTHGGRPVAVLPPTERRRWMPAAQFGTLLDGMQADAGLRTDLLGLADQTTDDLVL